MARPAHSFFEFVLIDECEPFIEMRFPKLGVRLERLVEILKSDLWVFVDERKAESAVAKCSIFRIFAFAEYVPRVVVGEGPVMRTCFRHLPVTLEQLSQRQLGDRLLMPIVGFVHYFPKHRPTGRIIVLNNG